MSGFNHKNDRNFLLATSVMLVLSSVSTAQAPPQRQVPPPPPPPPVVDPPPVESSDNEDNRRRSALVSCCLRRGQGTTAYCSVEQLDAAVKTGDLIRRENSDGSLYCAAGTGTVASRTPAFDIAGSAGQALASPLKPIEDTETSPVDTASPANSFFGFLFGFIPPAQ